MHLIGRSLHCFQHAADQEMRSPGSVEMSRCRNFFDFGFAAECQHIVGGFAGG